MRKPYALHATITPKRRAWLEALAHAPGTGRDGSVVGFQCMSLGWTQWLCRHDDGRTMPIRDLEKLYHPETPGAWSRFGDNGWSITNLEVLTDSGRQALKIEPETASKVREGGR